MHRVKLFIPLFAFLVLAGLLLFSLGRDPEFLPSALIDSELPVFELPSLAQPDQLFDRSLLAGKVSLLNVWASWCYACRIEHPQVTKIAREYGVPVYGLNYKDEADDANKWLKEFGDPYRLNLHDKEGRLGIDLGVYGAPETFVIDANLIIRYKYVGIIDERVWVDILKPLIEELRNEQG